MLSEWQYKIFTLHVVMVSKFEIRWLSFLVVPTIYYFVTIVVFSKNENNCVFSLFNEDSAVFFYRKCVKLVYSNHYNADRYHK